jgi:glycosyltransferase involved in cell wall biosynthesis
LSVDLIYLSRFNTCCGVSTYTEQLAEAVAKESVSVKALASDHMPREDTAAIPAMVSWSEKNVVKALSDVLEESPKVIHIQHEFGIFQDSSGLLKLCKKIKKEAPTTKLVLTAHTVPPFLHPTDDFLKTLERMDAVIVHSFKSKSIIGTYSGVKTPVSVIHHGMLPLRARMTRSAAEEMLGIKPDKNRFTLLSLGFLTRNKKHVLLSQIVSAMNKNEMLLPQRLFLIIAGMPTPDDEGEALLRSLKFAIDKFGLEKDVMLVPKFVPFEDLPAYYGAADMCVHFVDRSYHSSSGSIRMDLSYGMPVIAQKAELTHDLSPNTVALFREESDFMTQLKAIARNKTRLKKMSEEAAKMTDRFSWKNTANAHNKLYKQLAGTSFGDISGRVRAAIFHSCSELLGGRF